MEFINEFVTVLKERFAGMDFGDDDNRSINSRGNTEFRDDNFLDIQNAPHIVDPDEEFDGECCFWLMKLLRGHNVGRRLKRKVFKYAMLNFILGLSLLVITAYEGMSTVSFFSFPFLFNF